MRPCDQEDTWSETVIASEPVSLQAARRLSIRGRRAPCRNARLPDMCERARANAKAALGMARAPSFFTMSNSPLRGLVPRSTSLSRDAFLRPGWSLSIRARPEEGWAERRQAHYFVCRVCETRLVRASEARRVP